MVKAESAGKPGSAGRLSGLGGNAASLRLILLIGPRGALRSQAARRDAFPGSGEVRGWSWVTRESLSSAACFLSQEASLAEFAAKCRTQGQVLCCAEKRAGHPRLCKSPEPCWPWGPALPGPWQVCPLLAEAALTHVAVNSAGHCLNRITYTMPSFLLWLT